MCKVSIIIPVYNVEKYIGRCLDSVLDQTFTDFEVILMDDGSKDDSLEIIKKYELNNEKIRVFSEENSGPAVARNNCIEKARGEYIMFIDSDDYIDKDYLEQYVAASQDYDIVIGGFRKIDGKKDVFERHLKDTEFAKYVVTGPVCHLYKKELIINNNIRFLDTNMSEDVFFNVKIYELNPKIIAINYVGYNYYTNPESISNTRQKGLDTHIDFLGFMETIKSEKIKNRELHKYFLIRYIIWYLLYSGKQSSSTMFYKYYIKCFVWLNKNGVSLKNKYIRLTGPSGEDKRVGFIVFMFVLLHRFRMIRLFSRIYCRGKANER